MEYFFILLGKTTTSPFTIVVSRRRQRRTVDILSLAAVADIHPNDLSNDSVPSGCGRRLYLEATRRLISPFIFVAIIICRLYLFLCNKGRINENEPYKVYIIGIILSYNVITVDLVVR